MSHKRAVLYQARQGWVARLRLRPAGLLRSSAAISKDLALGVAAGVSGVRRLVNEGARAILVMCATREHAPGGGQGMTGGESAQRQRGDRMRRREFILLLAGTTTVPRALRAQ